MVYLPFMGLVPVYHKLLAVPIKKEGERIMDYKELASFIIEAVGGKANIVSLTHCATRLRFALKDDSIPDEKKIKAKKGVLGVSVNGGQYQIIIGNTVPKAYAAIMDQLDLKENIAGDDEKQKRKIGEVIMEFTSAVFSPILPALIGAGLINALLSLAVLLGMSNESNLYYFISIIGNAPLYFIPILLAYTASKRAGVNSFLAVALAGAMLHPNYIALLPEGISSLTTTSVMGIPVTLANYSSSVIPALLMVGALYYVDKFLDKVIPALVKFFVKPVLDLLIVGFLTFVVLGPVGYLAGAALCNGLNAIDAHVGWLVPTLIGTLTPLMVLTGMHNGLGPFMLQSFADRGYEKLAGPGQLPSNVAQGAAALAVALRTKNNKEFKQMSFSAGLTAVLGITEPAMFGVTLKVKKVLPCVMIGGGIGGFYAGITGLKCYSFCAAGLLALPAFVSPDGWGNLVNAVITLILGFGVTFVLVFFQNLNGDEEEESAGDSRTENKPVESIQTSVQKENEFTAPISGTVKPVTECEDEVFASEALGKGVVIEPEEGKVYAPCDGEISAFFETKHAIGITSEEGTELLIHVGMNTVTLNGEGFTPHAATGDRIKRGQLLLEFDMDFIRSKGLPVSTPVVIANLDDDKEILCKLGNVKKGENFMTISGKQEGK